MATGPEHYRMAEERMEDASKVARPDSGHTDENATRLVGLALQRAQVHATLALAAATALSRYTPEDTFPDADRRAWYIAASERPGEKQRQREAEAAELAEFAAEDRVAQAAGTEKQS